MFSVQATFTFYSRVYCIVAIHSKSGVMLVNVFRCAQLYVTLVSLAVFVVPTIIISVCYIIIISVICRKAALLQQEPIVRYSASSNTGSSLRPLRRGLWSLPFKH